MGIQEKGRQSLIIAAVTSGVLALTPAVNAAEEMDHSQMDHSQMDHGSMDHSQMDHSAAAQAGGHVHHSHGAGQWMFEYRYMSMDMEDLLDGSDSISNSDALAAGSYSMVPTTMTMNMHMLMAMYGFSHQWSGMVMLNYLDNEMDMVNGMGMKTSMDTSGIGDTLVGAMYKIDNAWTAALSLSIPTGATDEMVTMMGNDRPAPYGMQLGSGTYDLIPSITYKASQGPWTYGGQAEYTLRTGENDEEYTLGDKLEISAWGKFALNKIVALGGRLNYLNANEIDGINPKIMKPGGNFMAPTDDPANYGGTRLDLGVDVTAQTGPHTFGISYAVPIQQDVNGIQLETQSILTLSYMFMMM
ncbi:MAG: transporter [Gammaproteobacteria bacterium]|jgi:hypothetical protein